jgi:FkbM family methyltransferase
LNISAEIFDLVLWGMDKKYYSQNDEEVVIVDFFQKAGLTQGRFLDIGAYDGKAFSNTLRLAELGWGGVCVEPSPSVFPALLKLHGDNPNIVLINAAVGFSAGLVEFYDAGGDAISTTSVPHMQKWQMGWSVNYKRFFVYTVPISELFAHFGMAFEFINIDVEDANWSLFQALPFNLLERTRMICIEHDGMADRMLALAAPYGFRQVYMNGENLILAR